MLNDRSFGFAPCLFISLHHVILRRLVSCFESLSCISAYSAWRGNVAKMSGLQSPINHDLSQHKHRVGSPTRSCRLTIRPPMPGSLAQVQTHSRILHAAPPASQVRIAASSASLRFIADFAPQIVVDFFSLATASAPQ